MAGLGRPSTTTGNRRAFGFVDARPKAGHDGTQPNLVSSLRTQSRGFGATAAAVSCYSLMIFILISAATVWPMPLIDNPHMARWSFVGLGMTIVSIIIHVAMRYRNQMISQTLDEISETIDRRLNALLADIFPSPVSPSDEIT